MRLSSEGFMVMQYFHKGERQVQAESGIDTEAYERQVAEAMTPELVAHEVEFIHSRSFSFAASVDAQGRPWASPLLSLNATQMFTVRDETTVDLVAPHIAADPLRENIQSTGALGLLFLQPDKRRRAKSLGHGVIVDDDTIRYHQTRYFGLCPKYIAKRSHTPAAHWDHASRTDSTISQELADADVEQLKSSDTNFLASFHPTHGADVTHRGGKPGFIHVVDARTIEIPDYFGNGMFNTLGNLVLDNRLAFTDLDFTTGRLIQLTGSADVTRDVDAAVHGASQRMVTLNIEECRVSHAPIGTWTKPEPSQYSV